jgi:hypothetical protein
MQIAGNFFSGSVGDLFYRVIDNGTPTSWFRIWHAGNDGAGSGLDADLLDGENLVDNASTANTVVGRDSSGGVIAVSFTSTSDINLKTNIKPIVSPISKLLELNGVTFDWKETKESSIGVIAQEVERVFPELIKETNDNYKTVNYNGLVGVLIEAIKEQQNQIEELKSQINKS